MEPRFCIHHFVELEKYGRWGGGAMVSPRVSNHSPINNQAPKRIWQLRRGREGYFHNADQLGQLKHPPLGLRDMQQ